jgi:uncharacterized protein involved in outer membrane biogenesis
MWAVSVIIVLALLLIAAVKIFFPAEKVQALIVENIQKSLNRPVTVQKASVSIWGGIGLKLDSLVVQNNPGFAHEDIFVLNNLDVKLKLWPLIKGNFEFSKFNLDGLTINLEKTENGKLNFTDLGQQEEKPVKPAEGATSIPFLFDNLQAANSQLNFYDDSSGYAYSLEGMYLNTKLTKNGFEDAYYATGNAGISNIIISNPEQNIEFPNLTLDAEMKMKLNRKAGMLDIEKIDIQLADIKGQLDGQITSIMTQPACNLNFRTKKFSVQQLLSLVPPNLNPMIEELGGSGDIFASASLNGEMTDPSKLNFAGKVSFEQVVLSSPKVDGDFRIESGEINLKQKAANLLFESCTFAGEPFSMKIFIKDIIKPVVNLDLSMSVNLRAFRNYSPDIRDLSGRVYGKINLTSDIKNPESTRIDGGMVLEDLLLDYAGINQKIEEVDMELDFQQKDIAVDKFDAEIGRSRLSMDGNMKDIIPLLANPETKAYEPIITFNLDAPYLDLDELAQLFPIDTQKVAAGKDTAGAAVMMQKAMPQVTAEGKLKIDKGTYTKVEFENMTANLDFRDNILHLENMKADLYDGKATGETIVDYEDPEMPQFQVDFNATGIQINSFLSRATPLDSVLFGIADMKSSFSGYLGQPSEVLDSLMANGDVTMQDGRVKNLPVIMKISEELGFKTFDEEQIRNLQNKFKIEDGRIIFDTLVMRLSDAKWNVSGSAGFNGTLDYNIGIEVDRSKLGGLKPLSGLESILGQKSGAVTIPIRLTGTYSQPKLSVDRSKLIESADKKLKDEGKNVLENLFKKN